jgi:hypothetical protein
MGRSLSCVTREETNLRFTFSDTCYDVVQDLAMTCSNDATTFMKMIQSLISILDGTTIIVTFASEHSNDIDSVVVITSTCGRLYPISPPFFTRLSPYLTFAELSKMVEEQDSWNLFISDSPDSWLPAIAESLYTVGRSLAIHICTYSPQISARSNCFSNQQTCRRRLRHLVHLSGVLPPSFYLHGVQIVQGPITGGGFSVR